MTTQREGFLGDILDKVKDLITDDEPRAPKTPPQEDPPLTPQCCGPQPPGHPLLAAPVEHDAACPNHPDNLAKEEVAS
jgi:hypothetical protein